MRVLWQRYSRVVRHLGPGLFAGLAGALALAGLVVWPRAGAVAIAALVLVSWIAGRRRGTDRFATLRAMMAAGLGVWVLAREPLDPLGVAGFVLLLAGIVADEGVAGLVDFPVRAVSLPGFSEPGYRRTPGPFFDGVGLLVLLLAIRVWVSFPLWWFGAVALVAFAGGAVDAVGRLRASRRRSEVASVAAALSDYAPDFLVYYAGPAAGLYQVAMWLPYLRRTGRRHAVVARNAEVLAALAALSDCPVVYAGKVEALERLIPRSVGAIFYVNNDARNAEGVRLAGPTHVHLGHGDSEKPPSYAPMTAMFDRIFVAGQAGVDRFARHGVTVPLDKFRLVGRPQLEDVGVDSALVVDHPVVLYAPTWRGGLTDMEFGSLTLGVPLVAALLDLGTTVIFRPHPYSARDAESRVLIQRIDDLLQADGPRHLTSAAAARLAITDCFNRSTAAVADVSSVASDYLYTRKPLALTDTQGVGRETLEAWYPFARGCYLVTDSDPAADLRRMLTADPLADARAEVARYYLGESDTEGEAARFVAACLAAIREPSPRSGDDRRG